MPLTFYPLSDEARRGSLEDRIDAMMDAAETYKSIVMEVSATKVVATEKKRMIPRDQTAAYNWEEIARLLRQIRELPEITKDEKMYKAKMLNCLAEVYEVLRAAKMSKLEAVRLALISEANQLRGGSSQVA